MSTITGEIVTGTYCRQCGRYMDEGGVFCPICLTHSNVCGISSPPLVLMIVLNIFWNGLGNLAIGDNRGWALGFFNWLVLAVAYFTVGLSMPIYWAYCCWVGYRYLQGK